MKKNDKNGNNFFKKEYAKARNMMFYETSAKTAKQVDVAFGALSKKLMEKRLIEEGFRVFFKEY